VDKALSYTAGLGRDWPEEPMVFDAVCRNLEIIVEAARKLGDEYRLAHPQVAWRRIIGARNILAHAYDLIDPHILQDVVERDLPVLRQQVVDLLVEFSDDDRAV
jgi:uncharacterized protein with HEPN domain